MARRFARLKIQEITKDEYEWLSGREILVSEVRCRDGKGYRQNVTCNPPARMIVQPGAKIENVAVWNGEFCDPEFPVALVEPHRSLAGWQPISVRGTTRSLSGEVHAAPFTVPMACADDADFELDEDLLLPVP